MAKLPVYYDNKMNLLAFKNLDKVEANLFFSIVARFKDKGTEKLTLKFNEIAEFISDNKYTSKELSKLINDGVGKVVQSAIKWEMTPTKTAYFTLFSEFLVDDENKTLEASINSRFLFMLNEFKDGQFTMFELAEFSGLKSKYTQTLYRLLKQFRFTGFRSMKWGEFVEIMDIPTSYRTRDIDRQILRPAISELSQEADIFNQNNPIFKNLTYKKIRGTGRGRPIKLINFTFEPEPRKMDIINGKVKKDHTESLAQKTRKTIIEQKQAQKPKFNPITHKTINWYDVYISRSIKAKNELLGGFDSCKIMDIFQVGLGYRATIKNQENEKIFYKDFNDETHFKNWFKKVTF